MRRCGLLQPAKFEAVIVGLLLAASLAPFVVPAIPVATDLPKHLFVARVYADYHHPAFRFSEYFERLPRAVPTFLVTLLLAPAMKVVEPYTAGKLFFVA